MSIASLADEEFVPESFSEHVEQDDCPEFKI